MTAPKRSDSASAAVRMGGMIPALRIPEPIHRKMVEQCRAEAPLEACGILAGPLNANEAAEASLVTMIYPLRNAERSPTRFSADTRDLLEAHKAMRARGETIRAIYHSHPRWEPIPSATDLARNAHGAIPWVIVSLLSEPPPVRVWRLSASSYEELFWELVTVAPEGWGTVDRAERAS
ncbi:Mov34/MPN/PAD-1 family protein [Isosphaera pallida ATCC 43644]|uniref:Mov34/MPN/PAD-1 family protein n=1 Tax=Isosphaera pallida (strain ATCC 43644 / DSM 9630 / IS1B) TaxID=575540 RepID=E8R5W6_ISOPI|nr:M67 family metallopeptidase [Isosphaera pallida]ADV62873.1 Mov34/MPN/PAD-1 family protein [Isosphaera pallida ATCC 43644]